MRKCRYTISPPWLLLGSLLVCAPNIVHSAEPLVASEDTGTVDSRRAKQLYATGVSELIARDFHASYSALAESYRLSPSLETLYQLGVLANVEGRKHEAQDIMRRFAADKGHGTNAQGAVSYPHQADVQKILATTHENAGELTVIGPKGMFLLQDARLVGILPLARPLFMKAGEHVLVGELGRVRQQVTVDVQAGRMGEVRFDQSGAAPQVKKLAATSAILSLSAPGLSPTLRADFHRAVTQFAEKENVTLIDAESVLGSHPELRSCIRTATCKQQLAQKAGIDFVLAVRIGVQSEGNNSQWRVGAALLHSRANGIASQADEGCSVCSQQQALSILEETCRRTLIQGLARPIGKVQLESNPSGAEVWIAERKIGSTPLDISLFTGIHEFRLMHPDSHPRRQPISIESGKTRLVTVELLPKTVPLITVR